VTINEFIKKIRREKNWTQQEMAAAFGVLGILMMLLGYKIFDWIWPRIDVQRELAERNNIAVAIVIGAVIIAVAIVMSAAMT